MIELFFLAMLLEDWVTMFYLIEIMGEDDYNYLCELLESIYETIE